MNVGQLMYVIRKRIKLHETKALNPIILHHLLRNLYLHYTKTIKTKIIYKNIFI